jgi:TRAP-type mannitol/chloroaromatic compound transport system permease small subunit
VSSAATTLKKLDDGLARGEGALAAFILLLMIFLAASQAALYNLATRGELEFAQNALLHLGWIDEFLQKGTLWLAFLGASLATHKDQHIGIDVLHRVLPGTARHAIKALVMLVSSVTCFFLSRVFFATALGAQERPLEFELLGSQGPIHICDGSAQLLSDVSMSRPELFCGLRHFLTNIGAPVETPVGALQLIVPAMFLWMAVRFGARFVRVTMLLVKGDIEGDTGGTTLTGNED